MLFDRIKSYEDARNSYKAEEMLRDLTNTTDKAMSEWAKTELCLLLRSRRDFYHNDRLAVYRRWHRLIKSWDDGYIELVRVPITYNDSIEHAEHWFMEREYMPYRYCEWDCTGQMFTASYHFIKQKGRLLVVHYVSIDV